MIDQNSIQNLKNRLDIVDVIGSYIELKKSGANYKARCPFHSEDTPSFVVSPAKQIYHCFGCGAGGDAIKFVMEYEKLSYPEAIEKLADEFNVHLNYTKGESKNSDSRRVLEQVNLFYKRELGFNNTAKEYLKQRGVYRSMIERFEIGYAPGSNKLVSFLRENFLDINEALKCGIVGKDERGNIYARLIERITFPIYSPQGKIVGFGGRTITNHPAKYINSPQTYLFNKSRLLYGYHLAKEKIFKNGRIIICEGYLDVVMLHQAGFEESVATLGTALTSEHLPLLRRGEPKVILSYDGDSAGVEAAFKASKMLSQFSIAGGVVLFERGLDPADMVKNAQIDELNSLFSSPKPFVEFVLEQIVKRYDVKNPLEKERALREGIEFLKTLSPLLQEEYRGYFAVLLNVDKSLIKIKRLKSANKEIKRVATEDLAELSLIKTLLMHPEFLDTFLESLSEKIFKTHKEEFLKLIGGDTNDSFFGGISIRDDIAVLDKEGLKKQLCFMLLRHYREKLEMVKRSKKLDFEKKSFYIRKFQEKIFKLKKGELVAYE